MQPDSPLTPYLGTADFEAFAAAIAAAPDDQAPRLILADWFADREDEQAEALARSLDTRHFIAVLAITRYEHATGQTIGQLIARLPDLFAAAGRAVVETIGPAMQRANSALREIGERLQETEREERRAYLGSRRKQTKNRQRK
jgi:uncharacterized protein (TIGR02996 family)